MATTAQTVLQYVPSPASVSAKVHPIVIFNICDCYVRRPDQAERVIGTLLGSVLPDGTVDVRNSYAVPHNESSDQVIPLFYFHSKFEIIATSSNYTLSPIPICFMISVKSSYVIHLVQQIEVYFSIVYFGETNSLFYACAILGCA